MRDGVKLGQVHVYVRVEEEEEENETACTMQREEKERDGEKESKKGNSCCVRRTDDGEESDLRPVRENASE